MTKTDMCNFVVSLLPLNGWNGETGSKDREDTLHNQLTNSLKTYVDYISDGMLERSTSVDPELQSIINSVSWNPVLQRK